jgi:hypothetical protein
MAHYNWLAKWAEEQGKKRWNTVLKHHYVGHLATQAQWLHCRASATYLDEDYMGRVKHVAQKASGGWPGAHHCHCLAEVAHGHMA